MTAKPLKTVRPDAKGRIALGRIAEGVSSYTVIVNNDSGCIVLEPNVEIPAKEKWLFQNKIALNKVKKGLQDSAEGRTQSRGSFSAFTNEDHKK